METSFWRNNYVFITLCVCWGITSLKLVLHCRSSTRKSQRLNFDEIFITGSIKLCQNYNFGVVSDENFVNITSFPFQCNPDGYPKTPWIERKNNITRLNKIACILCGIYTAHKKFMNGFACRGFDPYVAIISTSRCQKTPVCKSAK